MKKNQIKSFLFFTAILTLSIYSLFVEDEPLKMMKKNFQDCNYEKTIELANSILQNPNLTKSEKTETYILKGISEFSTNHVLEARVTFMELILFDNNVTLNSKVVSPKIVEYFKGLKNKLVINDIE
jgi:hypothetical protein